MAAKEVAMVVILSELADSDDEKPTRGPTRSWIKSINQSINQQQYILLSPMYII